MLTYVLCGASGTTIHLDHDNNGTADGTWTLSDPYLIAWEDLPWNGKALGDEDYDDVIYLVCPLQARWSSPAWAPVWSVGFAVGAVCDWRRYSWARAGCGRKAPFFCAARLRPAPLW